MENGAEWRKRVNVSFAEAFKEELLHFHQCVTTAQEPLTDARDGREDIVFLQMIVAAQKEDGGASRGKCKGLGVSGGNELDALG